MINTILWTVLGTYVTQKLYGFLVKSHKRFRHDLRIEAYVEEAMDLIRQEGPYADELEIHGEPQLAKEIAKRVLRRLQEGE